MRNEAIEILQEIYNSTKCWSVEEEDVIYYAIVSGWNDLTAFSEKFGWSDDFVNKITSLNKRMNYLQTEEINLSEEDIEDEVNKIFTELFEFQDVKS